MDKIQILAIMVAALSLLQFNTYIDVFVLKMKVAKLEKKGCIDITSTVSAKLNGTTKDTYETSNTENTKHER